MKNKKILVLMIIFFFVCMAIFQYVKEFQSEFANAAYGLKPANGHSWSEMQCTEDICVDMNSHKVGIGTSNPGQKLEVNGNILASGDICNTDGACLSQITAFISSQPLINNVHNYSACSSIDGEVVSIGASYPLCRFNTASCPSGWTQYQNWATYDSHYVGGIPCSSGCTGPGSPWGNLSSNNPTFSCTYIQAGICWGSDGEFSYTATWSGDSVRSQIGCY